MTLLHKILITTEPTPIFVDFIYSNNNCLLRSSSTPLIEEQITNLPNLEKKTFHGKASNLWNRIPRNVMKTDMTFSVLKKNNKEIYH